MKRIIMSVAVALLMTTITSGCSDQDKSESLGSFDSLGRQLKDDELFLIAAQNELIHRCMDGQGFDYVAISPFDYPDEDTARSATDEELANLAFRQQHGYGIGERLDSKANADESGQVPAPAVPNKKIYDALPVDRQLAYDKALNGGGKAISVTLPSGMTITQPAEGCQAEATVSIYGDLEKHVRLSSTINNLRSELSARLESDGELTKARQRWSACMQDKGIAVESPSDLRSKITENYESKSIRNQAAFAKAQGQQVFAEEKRLSVLDLECDQATEYGTVYNDRYSTLEQKVIGDREGDILGYTEMQRVATAKAKELVGTSPARGTP